MKSIVNILPIIVLNLLLLGCASSILDAAGPDEKDLAQSLSEAAAQRVRLELWLSQDAYIVKPDLPIESSAQYKKYQGMERIILKDELRTFLAGSLFTFCMNKGVSPDSVQAKEFVKTLTDHIRSLDAENRRQFEKRLVQVKKEELEYKNKIMALIKEGSGKKEQPSDEKTISNELDQSYRGLWKLDILFSGQTEKVRRIWEIRNKSVFSRSSYFLIGGLSSLKGNTARYRSMDGTSEFEIEFDEAQIRASGTLNGKRFTGEGKR